MTRYLHWIQAYPSLKTVGGIYHYTILIAVTVVFMILVSKRLLALGYPNRRVRLFILLGIVIFPPAGYLSSCAAAMFDHPFDQWSVELFFNNMLLAETPTFHTSFILPLLAGAVFCRLTRLRFLEAFDAIFLYLPLAHAFGGLVCLFMGCCWGSVCRINLYGLHMHFQNPVPLYSMMANLCLFLFLRRIYSRLYADAWIREHYRGTVLASYFLIYPAICIIFEVFRTERRIAFGLTQAQFTMGIYLLFSMALFLWYRHRRVRYSSATNRAVASQKRESLDRLLLPAFFVVSYLLVIFIIYYLTRTVRVWQWPFQRVSSISEANLRILYYLPVMIVPLCSLVWLKRFKVPIRQYFRWKCFSWTFLLGLAVSLYYAVDLLVIRLPPNIRGLSFWPPILVLSLLNAVSEEIMYRLSLYRVIRRAQYPRWVACVVQSLIYSILHYMIAGALLGTFAFIYGLVMQLVANRNRSIIPAMICHFIIDIGCIGRPILRL
jgi:phosphatidylglycerol:prolipoprotein diacylglycerol transferase